MINHKIIDKLHNCEILDSCEVESLYLNHIKGITIVDTLSKEVEPNSFVYDIKALVNYKYDDKEEYRIIYYTLDEVDPQSFNSFPRQFPLKANPSIQVKTIYYW